MASAGDFARGIYSNTLAADRTPISVGHRIHGFVLSNTSATECAVTVTNAAGDVTYGVFEAPAKGNLVVNIPFNAPAGIKFAGAGTPSTTTITVFYSGV